MLKAIKKIFFKKTYIDSEGNRINPNPCTYCGIELGGDRFSFHKGMHFHSRCIKKWYANNQQGINNG